MAGRGVFITVEGMDGSGKTTVCQALYDHYSALYPHRVILTREPGGNGLPVCEMIRELVLGGTEARMAPRTEALLFAASRAEHIDKLIAPALKDGMLVISDRYVDSSIAYQGVGRGLGVDWVRQLNALVIRGVTPDVTVLLAMTSRDIAKRINGRAHVAANHLDLLPHEFHDAINRQFLRMADEEPQRFAKVDADKKPADVLTQAIAAIDAALERMSWSS